MSAGKEGQPQFSPRKLVADARVDACAKGEVATRIPAFQIDAGGTSKL